MPVWILHGLLARGSAIIPRHGNNTAISFCYTLRSESNRERVRDKQKGRDKSRQSIEGKDEDRRGGKGERQRESTKGGIQDVFTVELILPAVQGQTHKPLLFSPLNERMGNRDRLMQPSLVTLPSHHSLRPSHMYANTHTHISLLIEYTHTHPIHIEGGDLQHMGKSSTKAK